MNGNKKLDDLTEKVIKEVPLESPSINFTSNVMTRVLETNTNRATAYTPLIPKPVLITIFGLIVILFAYLLNFEGETVSNSPVSVSFVRITLSVLKFSRVTMYASVTFALILLFQISFFKRFYINQPGK